MGILDFSRPTDDALLTICFSSTW